MKKTSRKRKDLIVELKAPVRVRVYRGTFTPFEATRYLDAPALASAKSATIECGTVEAGGVSQTVAAEIRKGMVVGLKPLGCEGCTPDRKGKVGKAALKKAMKAVRDGLADAGVEPPGPAPVRISRRLGFEIPIGPIVIVIGDPAPGGLFDVCYVTTQGNQTCWWCLLGASGCMDLGPPL